MMDREFAEQTITRFLNDDEKKILLIKGYDNEAKLKTSLTCLNRKFKKGAFRTSYMPDISNTINNIIGGNVLPHRVSSTKLYKLGNMKINFSSYTTNTKNNPIGNDDTFTLYYPVRLVLDDKKRYERFLDELNNVKSSKVILITHVEWGIKNFDIENHVDEVFFYDVERDNPEIMQNLRNNGAFE